MIVAVNLNIMRFPLFIAGMILLSACQTEKPVEETTTPETPPKTSVAKVSTIDIQSMMDAVGLSGIETRSPMTEVIEKATQKIERGTVENGEGIFDVYKIMDEQGEELATLHYVEGENGDEILFDIEITSDQVATPEGIRVGDPLSKLRSVYDNIEISGSEIEGWTHAHVGDVAFRLESYNPNPNQVSVKESDKILYIMIR